MKVTGYRDDLARRVRNKLDAELESCQKPIKPPCAWTEEEDEDEEDEDVDFGLEEYQLARRYPSKILFDGADEVLQQPPRSLPPVICNLEFLHDFYISILNCAGACMHSVVMPRSYCSSWIAWMGHITWARLMIALGDDASGQVLVLFHRQQELLNACGACCAHQTDEEDDEDEYDEEEDEDDEDEDDEEEEEDVEAREEPMVVIKELNNDGTERAEVSALSPLHILFNLLIVGYQASCDTADSFLNPKRAICCGLCHLVCLSCQV